MKIITSPLTISPNTVVGWFSVEKPFTLLYCREVFSNKFKFEKGLFFSHSIGDRPKIIKFMEKTELILGLENKTKFLDTNYDFITWIELSDFWLDCLLKRSLLTILLRISLNYNVEKDDYEKIIFSDKKYIKSTRRAVMRFLYGFTNYTGQAYDSIGWVKTFSKRDDEFIIKNLVSLEEKDYPMEKAPLWI